MLAILMIGCAPGGIGRPRRRDPWDPRHMGNLMVAGHRYEFEDRALAHLKVAIGMKFRKRESFLLSWPKPAVEGGGTTSVWLSSNGALAFHFAGRSPEELNPVWVKALAALANSAGGMVVMAEEQAIARRNRLRLV